MNSAIVSVLGIYLFIGVGYLAKRSFKTQIDERTITLLSVYFLQIFLTVWGLLKRPIDASLVQTPLLYIGITLSLVAVTMLLSRLMFADVKERSIATVAALIGNTGNLGIPLGIALFGEQSVPYTTIINLANVFFVYTFGVFYYSRGNFSVRDSLFNIVKLPILWAALAAIALNLAGYRPSGTIEKTLTMGAYASMVMQLVLFGIYLYDTKLSRLNRLLIGWVSGVKFLIVPVVTYAVLTLTELDPMVKGVLFMEMLMPLAVANVNLGSLYDCRPKEITALVF
ncbi:MAG: AEC family transporter, partial [Campylobacterales bacterium]